MEVSLFQACIIGLLYYMTVAAPPWLGGLGSVSLRQPIVAGTIVGIILGQPLEGLIIGATINTLFLGFISAGGTVASEPGIAGIIGTALTIMTSSSPELAVSLAVPFGLLGTLIWNVRMTVNSIFVHWLDELAAKGDLKKMLFVEFVPAQLMTLLLSAVPVAAIVYFGGDAVSRILEMLTGTPLFMLKTIGGILPALGIAMTLRMISNRKGIYPAFLLGFFVLSYAKIPILVLAIFATIFAWFYVSVKFNKEEEA